MNSDGETNLDWALRYSRMGWSVVPVGVGEKRPALPAWKHFQAERPTERDLKRWWTQNPAYGIGVVLGQVSGGLIARDFDSSAAYRNWAARYPEEAKRLPTVQSGREGGGWHVYCRGDCQQIKNRFDAFTHDFGDGELRSHGAYIVVPPSIHDITGRSYTWLMPNASRTLLLPGTFPWIDDLDGIGFLSSWETESFTFIEPAVTYDNLGIPTTTKDCSVVVCPRMSLEKETLPEQHSSGSLAEVVNGG